MVHIRKVIPRVALLPREHATEAVSVANMLGQHLYFCFVFLCCFSAGSLFWDASLCDVAYVLVS